MSIRSRTRVRIDKTGAHHEGPGNISQTFEEPRTTRDRLVDSRLLFGPHSRDGEWESQWETASGRVAALELETPDDLTDAACTELLAVGRTALAELNPAPTEKLTDLFLVWVQLADSIGFDCEDRPKLADAIEELADAAADIDEELLES